MKTTFARANRTDRVAMPADFRNPWTSNAGGAVCAGEAGADFGGIGPQIIPRARARENRLLALKRPAGVRGNRGEATRVPPLTAPETAPVPRRFTRSSAHQRERRVTVRARGLGRAFGFHSKFSQGRKAPLLVDRVFSRAASASAASFFRCSIARRGASSVSSRLASRIAVSARASSGFETRTNCNSGV